jgi:ABC-type uncharacterized transport system ATPase subunit
MVAQGLSVIFISHKLGEVLRVSHRVAVLRGGKLVAEARTADTTQAQLALWMVGHASRRRSGGPPSGGRRGLRARPCEQRRQGGRDRLREVSLTLRAARSPPSPGVSGNGQVALAELLCGTRAPFRHGAVDGPRAAALARPAGAARRGAHPRRPACGRRGRRPAGVGERGVRAPAQPGVLALVCWCGAARRALHARRIEKAFDVRGAGLMAPARSLSGGNMQKLILGRALLAPEQLKRRTRSTRTAPRA